jgi:hypothetical protein
MGKLMQLKDIMTSICYRILRIAFVRRDTSGRMQDCANGLSELTLHSLLNVLVQNAILFLNPILFSNLYQYIQEIV